MQCWQCGTEVQPGERTCGYCGARLTTPPAGRSPRSSQQRYPSSRNAPRRSRDDDWDADAQAFRVPKQFTAVAEGAAVERISEQ